MSIQDLLHWWNLIYALPLIMSLIWILSTVFAGVHGHDIAHGDHGIGHQIGHVAHNVEQSVGHIIHHGSDIHSADTGHVDSHSGQNHGSHGHSSDTNDDMLSRACWLLGIGEIPITMLIGVFSLCWGVIGLMMNQIFSGTMKFPAVYIWPSMGVAFLLAFVITRTMAAIISRLIPNDQTYGVSRLSLVGSMGKTIYTTTDNSGTIDVKDIYGSVHRVQAKTEHGESIPSSTEVIIIDFDDADKRFIVRKGRV
ncbi:MAG: hypothetical protein ACYC27_02080 [Armatimonadota bacterium]